VFKQYAARLIEEYIAYANNRWRSSDPEQIKLLIFGQGRSGSTLLESLLESTGYFVCHGELLRPEAREIADPFRFVQGIGKSCSPQHSVFHLKIYQLTRDRENKVDPAELLGSLERVGWKYIYLKRENVVQQQLSNLLAEAL